MELSRKVTPYLAAWLDAQSAGGDPHIEIVVNAANSKQSIAPGSIASVRGSFLAPATTSASALPLPKSLDNVSVIANGTAVPVLYVAPEQIDFLFPDDIDGFDDVNILVNRGGRLSNQFTVDAFLPLR